MIPDIAYKMVIKAEEDYNTVGRELTFHHPLMAVMCFHCQQAVKKFLNVFLIAKPIEFNGTHNVKLLQRMCAPIDSDVLDIDLMNLNFFAVQVRYPDEYYRPDEEEHECISRLQAKCENLFYPDLE